MKKSILLLLFGIGLVFNTLASTIDAHDAYKKSFSESIGFFGNDVEMEAGSQTDESTVNIQFTKSQIFNKKSQTKVFNDGFLKIEPLVKLHCYIYHSVVQKTPSIYPNKLALFELYNNYRI
jgi:hypothetical protein